MTIRTLPLPPGTPRTNEDRLLLERAQLRHQLLHPEYMDCLGVIERARERREIRHRLAEIDAMLTEAGL